MTRRRARSVPELVDMLKREFEGMVPPSAVTEIVQRLSEDGARPLDALERSARSELTAKKTPPPP